MRIKRIHAETMQDALGRVREELGPDAVIVSTRPLGTTVEDRRRGLRGVEIVAGVDEQPVSALAQARSVAAAAASPVAPGAARAAYTLSMGGAPAAAAAPAGVRARKVEYVSAPRAPEFPRVGRNGEPGGDELDRMVPALEALAARGRAAQAQAQAATPARPAPPSRTAEERQLLDLIRARHDEFVNIPPTAPAVDPAPALRRVPPQTPFVAPPLAAAVQSYIPTAPGAPPREERDGDVARALHPSEGAAPHAEREPRPRRAAGAHSAAEAAFEALVRAGLHEPLAERALERAITRLSGAALADSGRLMEVGLAALVAGIPALALAGAALAGRTLLFTGPAGAGKTTALLKAAVQLRRDGASVAIIAADVSRIGAAEQLQRYGAVLRLPVRVAYGPEDVVAALAEAAPGQITLIDTPAFAPGADGRCAEVTGIARAAGEALHVLTVAAAASDAELRRLAALARATEATALAITKLDESTGAAAVLNVLAALRLPALLMSTGRDVIGELETATAAEVAGAVLDELAELAAA